MNTPTEQKFTEHQREACENIYNSIGVMAGAGSGKTKVLVQRILNVLQENNFQLDSILAITFTEKAAGELKKRLQEALPRHLRTQVSNAWIGTFHFAYARLLRSHAIMAGVDPAFRLLDENSARYIAHESITNTLLTLLARGDERASLLVDELGFRKSIGFIEELLQFRWHAKRLFSGRENGNDREKELWHAAAHCYGVANNRLQVVFEEQRSLDFQELELRTLDLLRIPEIQQQYQQRFQHILIDEYQDTNEPQREITLQLFQPGRNILFVVGDPRQSIYRFRGADVSCFADVLQRIRQSGGKIISLSQNFRSQRRIIESVNVVSKPLAHVLSEFSDLAADHTLDLTEGHVDTPPGQVTALMCSAEEQSAGARRLLEARAVATHFVALREQGYNWNDMAILFQSMSAAPYYERAFIDRGIPFRCHGSRNFFRQREIKDMMAILQVADNPNHGPALITLARSPMIGLSDDECTLLSGPQGKDFIANLRLHPKAKPLLIFLESSGKKMLPSELLRKVLHFTRYDVLCSALDPQGMVQASLERLLSIADSLERETLVTLPHFVRFVEDLREREARFGDAVTAGSNTDAVQMMTVHAAKGLEFPIVAIADLSRNARNHQHPWLFLHDRGLGFKLKDSSNPLKEVEPTKWFQELHQIEKEADEAESRRLLYVAMTRAEEHLLLPLHPAYADDKRCGKWHRWLMPLTELEICTRITVGAEEFAQKVSIPERPNLASVLDRCFHIPSLNSNNRHFTVSMLEAYDRCPQECALRYALNLPQEQERQPEEGVLTAQQRGTTLHRAIELLAEGHPVSESIQSASRKLGLSPNDSELNKMKTMLERFSRSPLGSDISNGQHEVAFLWSLAKEYISGTIDWMRPIDGGWEIVDFKTDDISEQEATTRSKNYQLQMACYVLAAEDSGCVPVLRWRLHFLRTGTEVIQSIDDDWRAEQRKHIAKITERIIANDWNLGEKKPPCTQPRCACPYHLNHLCWLDRSLTSHDL